MMKLFPEEDFPIKGGSVFQIGALNQFIIERFNTGIIAAPGKRANMEDCILVNQDLNLHPQLPISVYAVFDGHGGDWCAKFITQRFENEIKTNMLDPVEGIFGSKQVPFNECINNVLDKSFKNLDELYYSMREKIANKCGSTACVVLIIGTHIFCANVGDSRAVLSKNGNAINLSMDHKASRPDEVERIKDGDGQIELGRVGGKIAITRAFGDFEFKVFIDEEGQLFRKNVIIAEPEIRRYDYDPFQDEFIIIASDGLFDMFSS